MTAPKRRWFQFGLKRLVVWDVPFFVLMTLLWLDFPAPLKKPEFISHRMLEDGLSYAMSSSMNINLAILATLIWLLVPALSWFVVRVRGRSLSRPPQL